MNLSFYVTKWDADEKYKTPQKECLSPSFPGNSGFEENIKNPRTKRYVSTL